MSANSDPTRGCAGKNRYTTFTRAEKVAEHASKLNHEPMHAYKCRRCNSFHVGAHPRRKRAQ